ncbi:MAG: alanine racemase, partial [Bacteroidota bacterium]
MFQQLNQSLKNYKRAIPCLLLDLDSLDKNIQTLKANLHPKTTFRVVVKSLPCVELIDYIMDKTATNKLMVFHQPFLTDLASRLNDQADILLGKPMPIKTAQYFYKNLPENELKFNAFTQIQWLVDTDERIDQYVKLAKQLGQQLRLNLEIDVGLHRGGFADLESLKKGLQLITEHPNEVTFSGFMGYDPHVVKLPSILRSQNKALQMANDFYQQCKTFLQTSFPNLYHEKLTFNGAGSPTINLHQNEQSPLNDISAGSALVKPTDFDIPTLSEYEPACYIATPVLKKFVGTTIPALENMKGVLRAIDASNKNSYFIYGGFWKADYRYPEGAKANSLFGNSTNQTMLNAPPTAQLEVDDFVFLRPHQSEFVFLHFGNILAIRNGQIVAEWSLLKNY